MAFCPVSVLSTEHLASFCCWSSPSPINKSTGMLDDLVINWDAVPDIINLKEVPQLPPFTSIEVISRGKIV